MIAFDTSKPVLVTGATGYVAGWLIKRLLEEGFTVHATVRDPSKVSKTAHLNDLAERLSGSIRYFRADLMKEGSFHEAMQGCAVVFHTASPFVTTVEDAQRDLVDPAVLGTRNVLTEATKTESVTRVVVTSSCAAIFGDSIDLRTANGPKFTEQDWNTSSRIDHQPYSYSKVMAEREAWKISEGQSRFRLVTVNPALVLGPSVNAQPTSESFRLMTRLLTGGMQSGAPDLRIGVVDVRDVAEQHLRAAFVPEASGRYICSGRDSGLLDIVESLRRNFGTAYPLPKRTLPKWLVWIAGPLADKSMTRETVSRNVGLPWSADNTKAVQELGMRYRSIDETTKDMVEAMIATGTIEAPHTASTRPNAA